MTWQTKKLGEVLKLEYGKSLPKSKRVIDGKYPVYGANGEKNRSNDFYFDKPSIIVGRKGSAGELNLTEEKFWPLDVTYFVTFDEKKYDLKFLYNLLEILELPKLAKGVKPGINRNEVYSIEVATPPLPEQKRIVKKLDEVFEKVTNAKENTEKNLQNANELFSAHLNSLFSEGRENTRNINEVTKICLGLTHTPKYVSEGVPFLSVRNITKGHIDFRNTRYISRKEFESMPWGSKPKRGDVLFCRVGTIGYPQIVETDDEFGIFVSLGFFRVIEEVILNKYIRYWMMSPFFYRQVSKNVIGSTLKNLNTGWLKNFLIPVPSLVEQKAIVKKLDALSVETKKLGKIYEQKLADLEELKKSVLSKAFHAEL